MRRNKPHLRLFFRVLQTDALRSQLEEAQARNQKLRSEAKMVMTNVAQWISDQT